MKKGENATLITAMRLSVNAGISAVTALLNASLVMALSADDSDWLPGTFWLIAWIVLTSLGVVCGIICAKRQSILWLLAAGVNGILLILFMVSFWLH